MQGCERVIVACRVAIPVEAPERVLIVPWGEVERTDGDRFLVDEQAAASIIENFRRDGSRMVFDYEHHTQGGEFAAPDGKAVAAGWIDRLDMVAGEGIYAHVEWTPAAAAHIQNKEYRYPSFTGWVRKADARVMALKSVALTNMPAIRGMRPLVNKNPNGGEAAEESVMNKDLLKALGLADGAGEADVVTAVNSLREELGALQAASGLRVSVCKALGVDEKADDAAILTACSAKKSVEPNPAEFVPATELAKTNAELAGLKAELLANKAAAFLAGGEKAGKIVANTRPMWERLYKADPEAATKDLAAAPVIAAPDGVVVANQGGARPVASGGDRILANRDRFDGDRIADYERISAVAREKNIPFAQAMELCGAI